MKRLAPALTLVVSIVLTAMAGPAVAAKPKLSVGDVVIDESQSTATLTVTASRAPKRKASVGFSSLDQTATAGQDYSAVSGRLKIAAHKRSAKLAVPLTGDQTDETDEAFLVRLSDPKRVKVFDGEGAVTIRDDDPLPRFSITTTSVPEGSPISPRAEPPQVPHDLAVQLDRPSSRLVSVAYATSPGTATAKADAAAEKDFVAGSGTVAIPPGQTTGTIPLATLGDATDEFDQQLTIVLADPQGLEPAEPAHPVTIVDDDPEPTLSLGTLAVSEGTSGNPNRLIFASLSSLSEKGVSVDYATAAGTATSPADFAPASGHLSFGTGETGTAFSLTTVGDYDDEPDETLTVGFSSPVNASLPAAPQTLTITDDDLPCVAPDTPTSPPPVILGTVNGDSASPTLTRNDAIGPCGDADWYQFTLFESSGSTVDLHGRVTLTSTANDSPSAGDVDLCVQKVGVPASEVCSTGGAGGAEVVDICVDDPVGDQTTNFHVEVDGEGNAVNNYTLQVVGNNAVTATQVLHLGC